MKPENARESITSGPQLANTDAFSTHTSLPVPTTPPPLHPLIPQPNHPPNKPQNPRARRHPTSAPRQQHNAPTNHLRRTSLPPAHDGAASCAEACCRTRALTTESLPFVGRPQYASSRRRAGDSVKNNARRRVRRLARTTSWNHRAGLRATGGRECLAAAVVSNDSTDVREGKLDGIGRPRFLARA